MRITILEIGAITAGIRPKAKPRNTKICIGFSWWLNRAMLSGLLKVTNNLLAASGYTGMRLKMAKLMLIKPKLAKSTIVKKYGSASHRIGLRRWKNRL